MKGAAIYNYDTIWFMVQSLGFLSVSSAGQWVQTSSVPDFTSGFWSCNGGPSMSYSFSYPIMVKKKIKKTHRAFIYTAKIMSKSKKNCYKRFTLDPRHAAVCNQCTFFNSLGSITMEMSLQMTHHSSITIIVGYCFYT